MFGYIAEQCLPSSALSAIWPNKETFLETTIESDWAKEKLEKQLQEIELVKKIYPSEANFILIEVTNANELYNSLVAQKIITRNRNSLVNNCIRITVGSEKENKKLMTASKELSVTPDEVENSF